MRSSINRRKSSIERELKKTQKQLDRANLKLAKAKERTENKRALRRVKYRRYLGRQVVNVVLSAVLETFGSIR